MSKSPRRFLFSALVVGAVFVLAFGVQQKAFSHRGAMGIVKERMDAMGGIGKAMKQMAAMIQGQADYDGEALSRLAADVSAAGGKTLTDKFPHGSLDETTEALPVIWERWDRFAGLADELANQAGALSKVAGDSPDAAKQAFLGLAKTCKDCHGEFRLKK